MAGSKETYFTIIYLKLRLTGNTVEDQFYVPGLNHILSTINILYLLLRKRRFVL